MMKQITLICDDMWPAPDPERKRIGRGSKVVMLDLKPDGTVIYCDEWGRLGQCDKSQFLVDLKDVQ